MALDKILNLAISYPDFKLNQIIDPEQFDLNNKQLVDKINQIVGAINGLTQPGGAGNIGITPLPEFPETTDLEGVLRCILDYAIENRTQLGTLGDEIGVLFRDVYATITTIQGKNKEQDDKLAGLKVVDEINDARVGIVEGRVKTVEERATDLEVRIDGLEETNVNVEITSARTSGINGQTYQTIGKRIDDLEIGHDKVIPTGKRGRFNFVITDEESTKTWEDSVKQIALDTHEKDPSAHNLLFAGHELDETSHQDIRDEVERVGVNAGAEVSETQPTSGSKVWIENMGQNDLTNFNARHNVKNKEGEYDTYHFETNDQMVVMASGKTLAEEMAEVKASGGKEKRYQLSDNVLKTFNIDNPAGSSTGKTFYNLPLCEMFLKTSDVIKVKLPSITFSHLVTADSSRYVFKLCLKIVPCYKGKFSIPSEVYNDILNPKLIFLGDETITHTGSTGTKTHTFAPTDIIVNTNEGGFTINGDYMLFLTIESSGLSSPNTGKIITNNLEVLICADEVEVER